MATQSTRRVFRGSRIWLLVAAALLAGTAQAQNIEEFNPALACDASRGRCLLVIERFDGRIGPSFGRRTLHGRFVTTDGTLGPEFLIATGVGLYHRSPALAYDGVHDRFLLVHDSDGDLYGQLLRASNGSREGSAFVVSNAPTWQDGHHVAFEPQSRRFLVVWHDEREWPEGRNVYAQLVNADGTLYGTASDVNFAISDVAVSEQWEPSLAVDTVAGRFLVAWQDDRTTPGEYDIYGQLVDSDGTLSGTASDENFVVCDVLGSDQMSPSTAFDPVAARFLVVWGDDRNISNGAAGRDVYGQLVNANGSLHATASAVNRMISGSTLDQKLPVLSYDAQQTRFVAVWEDDRNMFPPTSNWEDILGGYVGTDGVPAGGSIQVATTSLFETQPVSAYEGASGELIVAYHVEAFGSDLQAIGVDGTVLPLPEPGAAALSLSALATLGALSRAGRSRCARTAGFRG